ncbi:LOW QUALITY PROTEIN: sperm microtubule associated protein 2 [Paramisgurnus dabryanus]|uniref:LOW QUALITY PROTEIN: sperm microtubule associated protein 2 n=1 Tax=Paramisgurnus dabryanus TaxID=90735 RepID=UPI0031F43EC7
MRFICPEAAMTTRIDELARPKPNLLKFPDRRSVYWLDELPAEQKKTSTTGFELTPRLEVLAQSKQPSRFLEESRRSQEWVVSAAALKAHPSQRVCSLALPRLPAKGWQPDRPLLTTLSTAVKSARASPRICQLAQPKHMKMMLTNLSVESSVHTVTVPTATPSARILQLASPKPVHPQHVLARPVSCPVPKHVLTAAASDRLHDLARPKTRQALFEGYDPYRVTPAARAATASPRLLELSLPLSRKCKG